MARGYRFRCLVILGKGAVLPGYIRGTGELPLLEVIFMQQPGYARGSRMIVWLMVVLGHTVW